MRALRWSHLGLVALGISFGLACGNSKPPLTPDDGMVDQDAAAPEPIAPGMPAVTASALPSQAPVNPAKK